MFKIKVTKPAPGVVYLKFKNQYETCSTFMRLQEFYESPFKDIRGKFFTLEDFMDRYAKGQGNFTYTTDWGGFNVPGNVVREFFKTFNGELLNKEEQLRELLKPYIEGEDKFYVIAMYDDGPFEHELCHALYYLNPEFKARADALVKALPTTVKETVKKWLLNKGYSSPLVTDETNAYLSTGTKKELARWFGKKIAAKYKDFSSLRQNFKKELK